MKNIIFMRHGVPEGRFKDYSRLSFKDLDDLLTGKISPCIDKKRTKELLVNRPFLRGMNIIICSQERRAVQTAEIIKKLYKIDYKKSSLLNEVVFKKGVISKENVEMHDFNLLRKKILKQFFYSRYSETFEHAKNRFLRFIENVKKMDEENILCITHGWFMRLTYIYHAKGSLNDASLRDLIDAKAPGFLDIIKVKVE